MCKSISRKQLSTLKQLTRQYGNHCIIASLHITAKSNSFKGLSIIKNVGASPLPYDSCFIYIVCVYMDKYIMRCQVYMEFLNEWEEPDC